MSTDRDRPPFVLGYEIVPFLRVGEPRRRFYCGIDAPRVEFPTRREPIWRGEVPDGATCERCGLALAELE